MDPSFLESRSAEEASTNSEGGKRPAINPVELATSLVSGNATCEELGRRAFAFFEASFVPGFFDESFTVQCAISTDDVMHTNIPPWYVLGEG